MATSHDLRPSRPLNAAELVGTRNRISLPSDVVRSVATLLGYAELPAYSDDNETPTGDLFDPTDVIELMVRSSLRELRVVNRPEEDEEAKTASRLLKRIAAGDYTTRAEVHNSLPPEKVALLKMGPTRLWGYAVRQRLPRDAERAVPSSIRREVTGPYTDPQEAWLGTHVTEASSVESLRTIVDDVPVDEDRHQRLRLGMGLADRFDQVWSSARGHWSIGPDTRYIVPSRYGWCPFVFRVADDGWHRDSFEGSSDRFIATHGYYIDTRNQRLIHLGKPDPHNAWRPQLSVAPEPPTDRDLEVATILTDSLIALGPSQRNPVIRLRQPGRSLI